MSAVTRSGIWISLTLLWGCDDTGPSIDLPRTSSPAAAGATSDRVAVCDQEKDGTACGQDRHCLYNACVQNACGDGIPAGNEACDDGNERDHDGCDGRCRMEVEPGCGNGVREPGEECEEAFSQTRGDCTDLCTLKRCGDEIVSPGEECDDGNTSNSDRCSSRCKIIPDPCGNGMIDPGEECDDYGRMDGDGCESNCKLPKQQLDAGPAEYDAGAALNDAAVAMDGSSEIADAATTPSDAGESPVDAGPLHSLAEDAPGCSTCRTEQCTVYQGVFDVVTPCFDNPDPAFVQQCIDVMNCAYTKACGYEAKGAPECFCGSVDLNTCQTAGAANGPCQAEWYAAARTSSLSELGSRFTDVSLPAGVAYYLIECDRDLCAACVPSLNTVTK